MDFRLNDAGDVAVRMPPISRSVRHDEGYELIREWIGRLPLSTTEDDNCSGALPSPVAKKALRLPLAETAH